MKTRLKIALKLFSIIDILFAEKWELITFKDNQKQAVTKYDSKEFKSQKMVRVTPLKTKLLKAARLRFKIEHYPNRIGNNYCLVDNGPDALTCWYDPPKHTWHKTKDDAIYNILFRLRIEYYHYKRKYKMNNVKHKISF
ncbi:hypothetical protein [Pedobacter sp.]|uniref:hypothetical protein n=1 Tax=Pedobacter sp. TaxID=1411316 RepID=UPI00396C3D9E